MAADKHVSKRCSIHHGVIVYVSKVTLRCTLLLPVTTPRSYKC